MADNQAEEFLTGSIDDYFLAIADSIHQAQIQLSRMKVPAQPGQPAIMYQLPRVDFELKMSFEVSRKGEGEQGLVLRARPLSGQQVSSQSATAQAASIIKGSFVAIPTDGGKPPSIIQTSLHRTGEGNLEVTVSVKSATGERLGGIDVEFNVDRVKSNRINEVERPSETTEGEGGEGDSTPTELSANTTFQDGKVTTNDSGEAVSTLLVDKSEPDGTHIVAIIDVAGEIETIVFKK